MGFPSLISSDISLSLSHLQLLPLVFSANWCITIINEYDYIGQLDAFRYARSPTDVFSVYNIAGMDGPKSLVSEGYEIQWEILLVEGKIVNLQGDGVQWFLRIHVPLTVHKYTFWKKK